MQHIKTAIIIVALSLITYGASAQRTSTGSYFVDALVGTSFTSGGANVSIGQYNLIGYWDAGIGFMDYALLSQHNTRYSYSTAVADGEYLFRLYGTRNRVFSAYLGAGLYLGAELSDPFHKLPENEISNVKTRFLCGIWPKAVFEVYITRRLAATVQAWLPINFNSQIRAVNYNAGLGVRYNF